ncbi:MAG: NAD(+)/NADH kinase [Chloroflexi bacterium]|nr:NAD(+)/NADH kinase [Chloroflexota bacterium]
MSEARSPVPRHVLVLAHPQVEAGLSEAERVAQFLQRHGVQVRTGLLNAPWVRTYVCQQKPDLVIALGGDGTMLRAGHLAAPCGVPILGINLGRFGFLIEVQRDEWPQALERLLRGEYRLERRMMLQVSLHRGGQTLGPWEVVNEAVVCRGRSVRPVRLSAYVDGLLLSRYVADGLIIATPTGSTAYALAAGGPILPPELRNILLVPVAPHLSVDRAVVLAEGSSVKVVPHVDHEVVLSIDGQEPEALRPGDEVHIRAGEHSLLFVRFQGPEYFYRLLTAYMRSHPLVQKLDARA